MEQSLEAATQHVTASAAGSSSRQSTIMEGFKKADKSMVDASLATWAYAVGIPFHKLDSKYFKEFCRQVGSFGSSYAPPGRDRLREGLLDGACNSISLQLQPFMEGVRRSGCIITSDGWDSVNSKPLLNIMVVTHQGVKFQRVVDMEREEKTGAKIAEILSEAVMEIGEENVVAVVTDGASNCKAAGKILLEE